MIGICSPARWCPRHSTAAGRPVKVLACARRLRYSDGGVPRYTDSPAPEAIERAAMSTGTPTHASPGGAPPPLDLTGRTVADFRVLRKLGQGGMGQVYLAE